MGLQQVLSIRGTSREHTHCLQMATGQEIYVMQAMSLVQECLKASQQL